MQSLFVVRRAIAAVLLVLGLGSCASYVTPGGPVELTLFHDLRVEDDIEAAFEVEPLAEFPATVAFARVQASGYGSHSRLGSSGRGAFSVITTREIEEEEDLDRIARLPGVRDLVGFNRMLVAEEPGNERELRAAAARLRADLVLIYTLDSTFRREGRLDELAVLSLGLFAADKVHLSSIASAILVDTRTGFVYGMAEASARESEWQHLFTARAYDAQRIDTEREAFRKLVGEVETMWAAVLAAQGVSLPAPGDAPHP